MGHPMAHLAQVLESGTDRQVRAEAERLAGHLNWLECQSWNQAAELAENLACMLELCLLACGETLNGEVEEAELALREAEELWELLEGSIEAEAVLGLADGYA